MTPLKVNDKVEVGDPIVYNTGFFEPDFFNPRKIVWKNAINARTVLWESSQTHEDSSVISKETSDKLTTKITKVKNIILNFDQSVSEIVKVGDQVSANSILCIIEDSITANNKLFSTDSIHTLKTISAQTPRAKVNGVIEKIEVFYHGDKEDMTESLRELSDYSDKNLYKLFTSTNRKSVTGKVDGGFRIDNNPLALDSLAIRIYITNDNSLGLGDKTVFCNQLKSCVGEVMEESMTTEDGGVVDAIFGYRGIEARIVLSPAIMGTTASLLRVIAKQATAIYRGEKK